MKTAPKIDLLRGSWLVKCSMEREKVWVTGKHRSPQVLCNPGLKIGVKYLQRKSQSAPAPASPPHPCTGKQPSHTHHNLAKSQLCPGQQGHPPKHPSGELVIHQRDHMTPTRAGWKHQTGEVVPLGGPVHGVSFILPPRWSVGGVERSGGLRDIMKQEGAGQSCHVPLFLQPLPHCPPRNCPWAHHSP